MPLHGLIPAYHSSLILFTSNRMPFISLNVTFLLMVWCIPSCLICYLSLKSQLRGSSLCEDFYNTQRLDSVPSYVIPGTTWYRAGRILVVNLQRTVKRPLGATYWKCNKRNNVLHIKTSLGTRIAWDRKEYYDSLVWVIVLLRDMTGKHSQSRHIPPLRVQPQAFRNTCGRFRCSCQYGWE